MRIIVDGLEREVREGLSVVEFLTDAGEPVGHVLVEVNGTHLRPAEYTSRILREGDRVEVILPASGG